MPCKVVVREALMEAAESFPEGLMQRWTADEVRAWLRERARLVEIPDVRTPCPDKPFPCMPNVTEILRAEERQRRERLERAGELRPVAVKVETPS